MGIRAVFEAADYSIMLLQRLRRGTYQSTKEARPD
jgi:hypothetical protein